MRQICELISPCGKRKLHLYERDDGRFWFEEIFEDFDPHAGAYWAPGYQSGLYDTLEASKTDMRSMTPWLRAQS